MTETAQLSQETTELLMRAATRSDQLSDDDSLDRVLSHLARSYLIANQYEEELSDFEEATDLEAEAEAERKRLRRWMNH